MWPSQIKSERGSALIAAIMLSLLCLGLTLWYLSQARVTATMQTHEHATEYALDYAETGLGLAEQQLQIPGVLAATGTVTGSGDLPNGRYAYILIRSSAVADSAGVNPFQQVLVDAYATGYYYLDKGATVDPTNLQAAQSAVLRTKLSYQSVAGYLVATPGTLRLNQRTSANFGPVYARDLIFVKDPGENQPPGVIDSALYADTVKRDDGALDPSPSYVVFNSSGGAQPIGSVPHFPTVDGRIRAYYKSLAVSDSSHLKDAATLDGRTAPPQGNPFPIYFCEGDLHLGSSVGFEPVGNLIVYVQGNLVVHSSIQGGGHSWAAFLVEKDIWLETPSGTNQLRLRGNFITNGALRWKGSDAHPESFYLTLTGSLLAGRGFDPFTSQVSKKLIRWQIDDALLPLPRLTQRLETQIVQGKYRH